MKFLKTLIILFFVGFFATSAAVYYCYHYFNTPSLMDDYFFIVEKGNNFKQIVNKLSNSNIIAKKNRDLFYYVAKIINKNKINIKAGEYYFTKDETPLEILHKLKNGEIYFRKLTIAEGLSNDSILKLINETYGLVGDIPSEEIAEGTLLPETYLYTTGETKKDVINRMQKAMVDFFDSEWERRAQNLPFKTKQEALSLASIVEKETGIPEERGRVASVFVNRLKKGMRLQSDPTVVYSFTLGNKDLERPIRKSDLARPSKYNTYVIRGIPESPIANPGKDSIRAVLNPDDTDYLYFVATGNGGHNFSKTLKEHNRFVSEYRSIINAKQ